MFIMSALRFLMVVLICVPVGYLLYILTLDLSDDMKKSLNKTQGGTNRKVRRNTIDGRERSVHNSRGPRWSR